MSRPQRRSKVRNGFRWTVPLLSLLFVSTASFAQSTEQLPAGSASDRYPDETWLQYATPEEAGWSSEGIEDALAFADSLGSAAVMLVHDGVVVSAWGDFARHANVASIAKALQSVLIGSAVEQGTIDLDATVEDYGIQDDPPLLEREKTARVRDLLTMRSGVFHSAAYESSALYKPERGSRAPGEMFLYNEWDVSALNEIYRPATGQGFQEAFHDQMAVPLDMEDYELGQALYLTSPSHSVLPHVMVRLSARDMARVGLLMLRDGRWQGEQIVPAKWVRESTEPHVEVGGGNHFGYMWWIPSGRLSRYGTFTASGGGNQSIMVLPELDLVFVHRATSLGGGVSGLDAREILFRLIDARTGEMLPNPDLVPLDVQE